MCEAIFDDYNDNLVILLEKVQEQRYKLQESISSYLSACEAKVLKFEKECKLKDEEISTLKSRVCSLEKEIEHHKEEILSFRRVSQIIHYEKENAKLHQMVKTLERKLVELKEKEVEKSDELSFEVFEKKIDKIVYYISSDSQKRIFEKLGDGEIGDELGYLVLVDGKLKPKWNIKKN